MSNSLENERSVTSGKMYPIDLAPQKITIVKSVTSSEVKMAHLIPGQQKTSSSGQIITHAGPVGLMRPAAQIISPSVASQSQMVVSGSPIMQGNQGSQLLGQGSQIISQSQLISSSGQILSPATQIISQGTQLSAQASNNNAVISNVQSAVSTSGSGTQVLNVGGQLVGGSGNLTVSSSVRTLPPSVRVLSPLPHHNARPVLSSVNVSSASGVLLGKSVGITSHVPRGLAAGASLAVRPVTPTASQVVGGQGAWSTGARGARGALVYGARSTAPRGPTSRPVTPTGLTATATHLAPAQTSLPVSQAQHTVVPLPSTTVLTSSGVISGTVRGPGPRLQAPTSVAAAPRPLPLLQRNYQPKVVGVASVGVRGVVGNSAPAQLYYEVPRAAGPHALTPRPAAPYARAQPQATVNAVPVIPESRPSSVVQTAPVVPRPSILRKRDIEGSPTKPTGVATIVPTVAPVASYVGTWDGVGCGGGPGSGGSTTISAASSPARDEEPDLPRDAEPRKKPRKQLLTNEVRQCEYIPEETPPTPPTPVTANPPPKRPLLSSSYVCGWRSTALHFTRPSDVRRREPRAKDILAIASQKHVLTSAEGWKVHHLTAQMDDLEPRSLSLPYEASEFNYDMLKDLQVSLEADVGEQLASLLRALETASGRALAALQPHSHAMMELLKGNIQRSKIVCEGIQEAREDILRVFTHRNFVSEILTRQADKRCFRKHRSQS